MPTLVYICLLFAWVCFIAGAILALHLMVADPALPDLHSYDSNLARDGLRIWDFLRPLY